MRRAWVAITAMAVIAGVALVAIRPSSAADHRDSPQMVAHPRADIADVYSFVRPEPNGTGGFLPSNHLVMVMTFNPGAKAADPFPTDIQYSFRIRSVAGADNLSASGLGDVVANVRCSFTGGASQTVVCTGNGQSASARVGEADAGVAGGAMRVFAGHRADPAFADMNALKASIDAKQMQFANPGVNTFAGGTVQAIVVELDVSKVLFATDDAGPANRPILAVSAQTDKI